MGHPNVIFACSCITVSKASREVPEACFIWYFTGNMYFVWSDVDFFVVYKLNAFVQ